MRKIKKLIIAMLFLLMLTPAVGINRAEAATIYVGTPKITAKVNGRTVTLSWKKVTNAQFYQILKYDYSQKQYRWCKTFKASGNVTVKLTEDYNKSYKYKVLSFALRNNKRIYGGYSNIVAARTQVIPAVELTTVENAQGDNVVLKWERSSMASGYQIYRSAGANGTFSRFKTVFGRNVCTYTDATSKSAQTTYYYKVRAYWKENGQIFYSPFGEAKAVPEERNIIFTGDSRVYMMQGASGDKESTWVAKVGAGYTWFKNEAVPSFEKKINSKTDVVIWIGTNDVYNINNYITYINNKAATWKAKGARVFVVGVGPVTSDPFVTNKEIEEFNRNLKNKLKNVTFIDLYTSLIRNGFVTTDGIHYNTLTSKKIYRYIISKM